jgi:1-aminocyclopropane-1-carboxylate deaminase/D-cysteine desulfhydrase-like pyridoxal-dependent ACC family enzyme/DNA modification methylase
MGDQFSPFGEDLFGNNIRPQTSGVMAERFMVAPFTVLNAREGNWQARKDAWISLGIRSEMGRGDNALGFSKAAQIPVRKSKMGGNPSSVGGKLLGDIYKERAANALTWSGKAASFDYYRVKEGTKEETETSGTSVFDPVLCELMYRWFCPPTGQVLDPFAGGSVRGIVAALMGRRYIGIELRPEQVEANIEQARLVLADHDTQDEPPDNTPALTPVEQYGNLWLKREDLYVIAGARGGKARAAWILGRNASNKGAKGLVTAGSRSSPQINIVAHVGRKLGLPVRAHAPRGPLSPELICAQEAGAEIVQHDAGYNTVIKARAREDAAASGFHEIPFGMECDEAVELTAAQVQNIPPEVKRIVVPVGSGITISGILRGLLRAGRDTAVLGVVVGADPTQILNRYAPKGWETRAQFIKADQPYQEEVDEEIAGIKLDPVYEAKCAAYIKAGDCLWIVGVRQSVRRPKTEMPEWVVGNSINAASVAFDDYDFILSCPPYYDLEVYSDLPGELSAMPTYQEFLATYREIIARCTRMLKPDRFACFVVGDIRDKAGHYRCFPWHTIEAFEEAGLRLYNDAVLVTAVGSLPIRTGRAFSAGRKLGKTHQNIQVFIKGDSKAATAALEALGEEDPE